MSINEVIRVGADIPTFWEFANFETVWSLVALLVFVVFIGVGIFAFVEDIVMAGMGMMFLGTIFGALFLFFNADLTKIQRQAEHLATWQSEMVIPFIEELPESNITELVQFVEKDPVNSARGFLGKKLTTVDYLEDAEYGELKYIENGIEKSERGWFILKFIQTGEPSYSYKEVTDDLSETLTKGAFNKTLTLPSDKYDFEGTNVIYFNKE